jgi:hypothetical protein
MEPDQINILALTVLRHLQKIDHTKETRFSSQLWGNVRKADRLDGIHFDLSFFHRVSGAHSDMWAGPDPDTACDFSAPNSFPKSLGEHHQHILDRPGVLAVTPPLRHPRATLLLSLVLIITRHVHLQEVRGHALAVSDEADPPAPKTRKEGLRLSH